VAWIDFWILLWQAVIALLILVLPLSLVAYFLASAISSGIHRPEATTSPKEEGAIKG
jgi:hypothetical protein